MNTKGRVISLILLLTIHFFSFCQDITSLNSSSENNIQKNIYGFIRGGCYAGLIDEPYISSAYSDFGLKVESIYTDFKAFADIRFRYGAEFLKPVNHVDIREAFIKYNGKRWDISAGQKIVKWGRADFTNPTSKLSSQNLISRSPDREDMDVGNLLSSVNWYPSDIINIQAVIVPFYRPSTLVIDPFPLPENVSIAQIGSMMTDREMLSYGLKADFHLKSFDGSLSWFDGYDPMPGIALTSFNLDLSGPIPLSVTDLSMKPYKTKVLGFDFETTAGAIGLRGEAAWMVPYLSHKIYEYVPWPEIKWVVGIDWTSGIWRISGEYWGKNIPGFSSSPVDPIIGTEPDYSRLTELMAIPGFNLADYVSQQVGAFNRLYNYQLEKYYHSAGLRAEAEFFYGKLLPSLFTMYNFTSHDLLVIPEMRYKPSDGLTITVGAELYSGRSGSLYDIIDEFMNCLYIGLKVDF